MIPNDIEFLQAETLDDAVTAWREAHNAGRRVRYFGGGTELITGARERSGEFDVLIDLKRIPETTAWAPEQGAFGAATRLSALADQKDVPLLAAAARGVADRTVRTSVTLGGNLCSMLPYRETALPLLLFDAELDLYGTNGPRRVPATATFSKRLHLEKGELVVSVRLRASANRQATGTAGAPWFYGRRTRDSRVDYPVVTLCAVRASGEIRVAVGGAYGYPVRSPEAEAALNGTAGEPTRRAAAYLDALVAAAGTTMGNDMRASGEYRRHLLSLLLTRAVSQLETDGGES